MTTKAVGHQVLIGDLGASIGVIDKDRGNHPFPNPYNPEHNLGLISGTGKLISELGSNLVGLGAALHTATALDISSPTKRLTNAQQDKNSKSKSNHIG